jgi:hypothetical protein
MFMLAHLQMQAHLLFQVRVELPAIHQHPESSCEFAPPVHFTIPFKALE